MTMSPRLDLRTAQTLIMTPQLQQAIKLLQMSNQELGEFVATEIEQNPLLEQAEDTGIDVLPGERIAPKAEDFAASREKSHVSDKEAPAASEEAAPSAGEDDMWANDGYM